MCSVTMDCFSFINSQIFFADFLINYLNSFIELRWIFFFLFVSNSSLASENINGRPRRQQSLVLLPFQCLAKQSK